MIILYPLRKTMSSLVLHLEVSKICFVFLSTFIDVVMYIKPHNIFFLMFPRKPMNLCYSFVTNLTYSNFVLVKIINRNGLLNCIIINS